MLHHLRPALTLVLSMTLLTGLAYPLAVTGLAGALMPAAAHGSLVLRDGAVVGSALIGQDVRSDRYVWPRPSATAPVPYNAAASAGSNLAPTAAALKARVEAEIARLAAAGLSRPIPADAVTTSGSGLDPDISPAYATAQVERVARARGLAPAQVARLVAEKIHKPVLGFIGEARVNVLELNLALDALNE